MGSEMLIAEIKEVEILQKMIDLAYSCYGYK
jgi:hypothetical protein